MRGDTTPRPVLAVGAVIAERGELLMIRRARPPAEGLWTLPGGRVEAGETLEAAVIREVHEETGLEVRVGGLLGVFEVVDAGHHFVILDHEASITGQRDPRAGSDAGDARWVPLNELDTLPTTPRLLELLTTWGVVPERPTADGPSR